MLVLLVDQRAVAVLDDPIDLDLGGDHFLRLQAAVVERLDHAGKVLLEVAEDCVRVVSRQPTERWNIRKRNVEREKP